ncbi:MAG: GNAT family N-acetyltransferase [Rubrobacteraceae bacterium]
MEPARERQGAARATHRHPRNPAAADHGFLGVLNKSGRVWVAELGASAIGFVAIEIYDPERSMGEISMLAVDPDHQGGGIGTTLTEFALDRLKDAGMKVAMVETGGDPGHAAARRTYEKADYVLLPIARYFKNL